MRKSVLCFLLAACYAPAVFAADGAAPSRAIPSATPTATVASRGSNGAPAASEAARTIASRAAVSRVFTGNESATQSAATVVRSSARVVNLSDQQNSQDARDTASSVTRSTVSRVRDSASDVQSAREKLNEAASTVGRSANDINSNPTVRRAGLVLRPTVAELGGRATIGDTDIQTGSNIGDAARSVTARAGVSVSGATTANNAEAIAAAKETLEQTADLNKSCQEQYNECMDQFCAVIDANQKRCSCSANLSRYTKVETAVKDANTQLNDVAQRIRYVGLSADEIRAIMNATEAEEALSGQKDTTETRSMLEEIEELIKDPTSAASYSSDTFSGLDMSLDFSSDASDLFNLDFLTNNTSSFSNLRGTELYNAAKKRCNTIVNKCKDAGATAQQITGNYDLAIDKDCVAYEQGLTKMNETLVSNVRSANLMLQKARLAVLQNKNQYDAKGCISALDNCMRDEMVCGDKYTKCLDPTKTYIDENGNVVLGQNITKITGFMTGYNNADITDTFLGDAYKMTINTANCTASTSSSVKVGNNGACIVKYLLQKIGTGQKVTDGGLCRAVLDKCQMYTYSSEGTYNPYNAVVENYVQRAMVNIRAAQQQIIADYSSSCMLDIASCYNQQVTQVNAWSSSANIDNIYRVMRGACRNIALTCGYAVLGDEYCATTDKCIDGVSEMFYQSLLCPDNSTYNTSCTQIDANGKSGGCVNNRCKCAGSYETWNGSCLAPCGSGEKRDQSSGVCKQS